MMYTSIILSGLPGSGKSTLQKELSNIYGWPTYSLGQLWRQEWARQYPDGEVSFEEFWRTSDLEVSREMNRKAREVFAKGNVIGDTRYSPYCKDLPALLVFVTADIDVRAKRALDTDKYPGKSVDEIKRILLIREQDEVKTGRELFGADYDYRDPTHYHLSVNTSMLPLDEELSVITKLVPPHFERSHRK